MREYFEINLVIIDKWGLVTNRVKRGKYERFGNYRFVFKTR